MTPDLNLKKLFTSQEKKLLYFSSGFKVT